jgi:hypothetical protein
VIHDETRQGIGHHQNQGIIKGTSIALGVFPKLQPMALGETSSKQINIGAARTGKTLLALRIFVRPGRALY